MQIDIIQLAKQLASGKQTRIPAMKAHAWDDLRWWVDYLRGYAL